MLSIAADTAALEARFAGRELWCPGCGGALRAWGYARERQLRTLEGAVTVRPRRARCPSCARMHVLLPAFMVPRRSDNAEVIGEALRPAACGAGHRRIAARLGRPPGTVRGWLRAFARRAHQVGAGTPAWARRIDGAFTPGRPVGSPLANAVEALAVAARTCRLFLRMPGTPWGIAVVLTTGLLHGPTRVPGPTF